MPGVTPKIHSPGLQRIRVYGERDIGGSQTSVHTPQQEMEQGIHGDVRVQASIPVTKTTKTVLAPTEGGMRE